MAWNTWFFQLASPPHFYRMAGTLTRWFAGLAIVCVAVAAFGGLVLAPPDYKQGEAFRIIYVHVPSAYLSMMAYVVMAVAASIGFIWRIKLAHAVAVSTAPIGASFTAVALMTGMLWGKPMWGTYWQWADARLMSELFLLFLFLGYIGLRGSFEDPDKGDRVAAILAAVGVVNVPIIHYSVVWWSTLHQPATIAKLGAPSITWDMLWPLLLMIVGFTFLFAWLLMLNVRSEVLEREQQSRWVRRLAEAGA